MRQLVARYTEPLLARIPDFSADPPRRQAAIGLAASIIVHLLVLIVAAIGLWVMPDTRGYENVQEEAPLEIEIVPPREKPEREHLTLDEAKRREVLLSRGLTASEEKPKESDFESDQNMVAGSELPADGLLPLPSQQGRTDLPGAAFSNQDVIVGATENAAASIVRAPKGNEPPPLYKPQPLTQSQLQAANEASPTTALPQVSATPPPRFADRMRPATPPPSRKVPKPGEGELAFATQKPATPAPVPKTEPKDERDMVDAPITRPPMATPPSKTADMTPPQPVAGSTNPGYREQLEKVRVEGAISNRGRPGVNAEATPMGIYQRKMSSLIGSRWNFYVKERWEFLSKGSVRVRYIVNADGRIEDVSVEANDANRALADLSVQAVRESKLPPLPEDMAPSLNNGRLEMVFTFTLF